MPSSSPLPSLTFQDNELLINYHDAVIYVKDLKLIERPSEWLNDSCINFYFTYLQQHYKSYTISSTTETRCSRSLLFMDPSVVSFWMQYCIDQDEIDDFVQNTPFPGKETGKAGMIFIAVNDKISSCPSNNSDWQINGNGNHWSLLMVEIVVSEGCQKDCDSEDASTKSIRFCHFDSVRNSGNLTVAEEIAAKICMHVYPNLSITTKSTTLPSELSKICKGMVYEAETPQQRNGYDCGVHVLGAAKIISQLASTSTTTSEKANSGTGDTHSHCLRDFEECLRNEIGSNSQRFCSELRNKISSVIRRLHQEKSK